MSLQASATGEEGVAESEDSDEEGMGSVEGEEEGVTLSREPNRSMRDDWMSVGQAAMIHWAMSL
jgi:hypothetical protein